MDSNGYNEYISSGVEILRDDLYKTGYAWFVHIDKNTTPSTAYYEENNAFDIRQE